MKWLEDTPTERSKTRRALKTPCKHTENSKTQQNQENTGKCIEHRKTQRTEQNTEYDETQQNPKKTQEIQKITKNTVENTKKAAKHSAQ